MSEQISKFDFLSGANASYIYDLYRRFLINPHTIDESWREIFSTLGDQLSELDDDFKSQQPHNGSSRHEPKYAHVEMPDSALPLLNHQQTVGNGHSDLHLSDKRQTTLDSIQAIMMIRAYRVRGHLYANLDPLQRSPKPYHRELDPASYGFLESDYDRPIFLNYVLGLETATLREVLKILQNTYTSSIGIEFMQTQDPEHKSWIQQRIEMPPKNSELSGSDKKQLLRELAYADAFEKFLATKHIGVKRFGLEGGESTVSIIEHILRIGSKSGLREMVMGMAHRGRLNFIANIFKKPLRAIFSEFRGNSPLPEGMNFSGDVKYHLGLSVDRTIGNNAMHLSLTPNPSHLEAVNTVVLGKVYAKQMQIADHGHEKVMGILVHGDASFAGQGVVAETFLMSKLYGYRTGGTIHLVINNQIGFTTVPEHSRSSAYCSDIANVVGAPIFHVNGDDVESCLKVAEIAIEYRQRFKSDVVIDVICYRRHGHNESDEPMFTQPNMYKTIAKQESTYRKYRQQLLQQNEISPQEAEQLDNSIAEEMQLEYEAASGYKPNKADWLEGVWSGIQHAKIEDVIAETGVATDKLKTIGQQLCRIPSDFKAHSKIVRILNDKIKRITTAKDIDWATAEALAIGSLLDEGIGVRLSGEDSKRGTFSQRHAVLIDQENENAYIPLNNLTSGQAKFEILDSPLSEYGVLGFEYGYASSDPHTLVMWEAQYGDFANGAQVVIDQFVASGEVKWLRMNGLVMLLPHGYEGSGPEHSSARLERYLQLCAENNLTVCNLTTPANYFHVLRRQVKRNIRKPLILMTPKSLLRHKLCVSELADFDSGGMFRTVLPDSAKLVADKKIRRVIICSGKIYYDLFAARAEQKIKDIYLVRLEQLYPFPTKSLLRIISRFPMAEFVWCQEEPENMGAWNYLDRRIEQALAMGKCKFARPHYIGRPLSASPATGLMRYHFEQQTAIIAAALTGKI